jgi:hypothetical protein
MSSCLTIYSTRSWWVILLCTLFLFQLFQPTLSFIITQFLWRFTMLIRLLNLELFQLFFVLTISTCVSFSNRLILFHHLNIRFFDETKDLILSESFIRNLIYIFLSLHIVSLNLACVFPSHKRNKVFSAFNKCIRNKVAVSNFLIVF